MIERTDIDWTNPDADKLAIFFNKRIEQLDSNILHLKVIGHMPKKNPSRHNHHYKDTANITSVYVVGE